MKGNVKSTLVDSRDEVIANAMPLSDVCANDVGYLHGLCWVNCGPKIESQTQDRTSPVA